MNYSFSYLILFLFFTANLFCQDVLVKNDSSKIEVKLLEVRPSEIKYKLFNYQDGPDIIIRRSEIAYVIYSNSVKEVFKTIENPVTDNVFVTPTPLKGSVRKPDSIGNYIKFNLQLGVVMQNISSNYMRREPSPSHTSSEEYSASSNKYIYNYNIGFNFLFGKSPYIKHVIGVNYLRSTGEYNYKYHQGGYTSYYQNFSYVSKIDFINIVTGLRIKVVKGLYIEPLVSLNAIINSDVRRSGISSIKYSSGGPVYKEETEYDNNKKVSAERSGINSTVSLCPKLTYEFNLKNQTLGIYVSYNHAAAFRLPCMMAGITYYPFKKLK